MDANSVDAIVTDPPYGLEFMGKSWDRLGDIGKVSHAGPSERDGSTVFGRQRVNYNGSSNVRCRTCNKWKWGHVPGDKGGGGLRCQCEQPDFPSPRPDQARIMQAWHEAWAREALRVLKPGGHLLTFGGTRTYHRMACAIEDAGFEIRDSLMWLFGSGFPKSHNLRGEWEGWGTALKPGYEPIVLARKPLSEPTVAANVLRWSTGALNIDASRIAGDVPATQGGLTSGGMMAGSVAGARREPFTPNTSGRWPANVILSHSLWCVPVGTRRVKGSGAHDRHNDNDSQSLFGASVGGGLTQSVTTGYGDADGYETVDAWDCAPDCPVAMLDAQSGERKSGAWDGRRNQPKTDSVYGMFDLQDEKPRDASSGGASRFFYVAKASRAERDAGLADLEERPLFWSAGTQNPGSFQSPNTHRAARNHHPTVKPVALMRYLVQLVTPPGGVVLDPFAGSGTTLVACAQLGVACIGIEKEAEYVTICERRLQHAREAA